MTFAIKLGITFIKINIFFKKDKNKATIFAIWKKMWP